MRFDYSASFKQCMVDLDPALMRKLWGHVFPHLPGPKTDDDALIALHHARTQSLVVPLKLRAYSHRWLLDHGYPSGLPDELKSRAERMYPKVVEAVGISVKSRSPERASRIRTAMEEVVLEAYADKRTEPEFVRARMLEARERQNRLE